MTVITLVGGGQGRLKELANLVGAARESYGDLAVERFDAAEADFDSLQAALTSVPFLASGKCVVIAGLAQQANLFERLQPVLLAAGDSAQAILNEPHIDKRTQNYKWLQKHTDLRDFSPQTGAALVNFVLEEAKAHSTQIDPRLARLLIDQVGEDEHSLATEIAKLSVYDRITEDLIKELVVASPRSKIFDLLDAAARRDGQTAQQIYDDQRAQKVEPQAILAMIIWQLQLFVLARTMKASTEEAAAQAGVSAYPLKKAAQAISKTSLPRLQQYVDWALEADTNLKIRHTNSDQALQLLIAQLCS